MCVCVSSIALKFSVVDVFTVVIFIVSSFFLILCIVYIYSVLCPPFFHRDRHSSKLLVGVAVSSCIPFCACLNRYNVSLHQVPFSIITWLCTKWCLLSTGSPGAYIFNGLYTICTKVCYHVESLFPVYAFSLIFESIERRLKTKWEREMDK